MRKKLLSIFLLIFILFVFIGKSLADSYLESAYYALADPQPDGFYLWIDGGSKITSVSDGTTQKRLAYNLTTAGVSMNVWHNVVIQAYKSGYTDSAKAVGRFNYNVSSGSFTLGLGVTVEPGHGTGTITPGHGTGTVRYWEELNYMFYLFPELDYLNKLRD
jgi:hypothetical protein